MRLRFTIRELFWLTLVLALAAAWWHDWDRIRKRHETLDANRQQLLEEVNAFKVANQAAKQAVAAREKEVELQLNELHVHPNGR